MDNYYTQEINNSEMLVNNIIKRTIKEKIINLINNHTEDYNFKQDIMDEIATSSNHIFKDMDINQLEENYKEIFIEDTTSYYYERCIENLTLHNENLIIKLHETEILYIIINNNTFNNNVQYGIISDYEEASKNNYYTVSDSELKIFQDTFNQDEFIILTDNMFIFVIKLDFIQEELLNTSGLHLK